MPSNDPWDAEERREWAVEKTNDHIHISCATGHCILCGVNVRSEFGESKAREQAFSNYYGGRTRYNHPDQDPCTIDPIDPLEE